MRKLYRFGLLEDKGIKSETWKRLVQNVFKLRNALRPVMWTQTTINQTICLLFQACRREFREFLAKEFSEENLDFFLDVENYKKQKTTKHRKMARDIYIKYITTNAENQVGDCDLHVYRSKSFNARNCHHCGFWSYDRAYSSRPHCVSESLKTSSDWVDSNASFEVCCAYMWRHCDVFFWEKTRFSRCQKNSWFVFIKPWSGNEIR